MPISKQTRTLYRAHRVLITTAAICSLVMSYWGFRIFRILHDAPHMAAGILGVVASIGLFAYLVHFNRKVAKQEAASS